HAARRRRFAAQGYEPAVPSRFLSEIPPALLHDTSPVPVFQRRDRTAMKPSDAGFRRTYNSVESIHQFFESRGGRPEPPAPAPATRSSVAPHPNSKLSAAGWRAGARVRHPKFGIGTVLQIDGEGELTKLTVSFPGFGLKKLVESIAGLTPV
ncbi:MAG: hypothetical protein ACRD1Y_07030, partial [Terriglobales bacterium]